MACPLSALIEARFTDFSQEGKDYPNVSVLEKKFVSQRIVLLSGIAVVFCSTFHINCALYEVFEGFSSRARVVENTAE